MSHFVSSTDRILSINATKAHTHFLPSFDALFKFGYLQGANNQEHLDYSGKICTTVLENAFKINILAIRMVKKQEFFQTVIKK